MTKKSVSRFFAFLLSAALIMTVFSAVSVTAFAADKNLTWSNSKSDPAPYIAEEYSSIFDDAAQGYQGAPLTPLACYGAQVVAGMNYAFICRDESGLKDVRVYQDTNGVSAITSVEDFDLNHYAQNYNIQLPEYPPEGGMEVISPQNACTLPDDAQSAYNAAMDNMDGVLRTPLAFLGRSTDTDNTKRFAILCLTSPTTPYPDQYVNVAVFCQTSDNTTLETVYDILGTKGVEPRYINNDSYLSTDTIRLYETVTITAAASGGTAPYTFHYAYRILEDQWGREYTEEQKPWNNLSNGYISGTTKTLTPGNKGKYLILVSAMDAEGTVKDNYMVLTVTDAALTNKSVVKETTVEAGTSVTMKGVSLGGEGNRKYAYYYKLSSRSSWNLISNGFVTNTKYGFRPTKAGDYDLRIDVRDDAGTVVPKTFKLKVTEVSLRNGSSLSETKIMAGEVQTITASATGGKAPYTYRYLYKLSTKNKWNDLSGGFVSDTSKTLAMRKNGVYNVRVIVKDSLGNTVDKQMDYSVGIQNNSYISKEYVCPGNIIYMYGRGYSGVEGGITFAYYYKLSTKNTWNMISDGFEAVGMKTLILSKTGTYDLRIVIKDSAGNIADKQFKVVVDDTPLVNVSTINSTSLNAGQTVKLYGAATGAAGTAKYYYQYKPSYKTNWTNLSNGYVTDTEFSHTVSKAGSFDYRVTVSDQRGKTSEKKFTVVFS